MKECIIEYILSSGIGLVLLVIELVLISHWTGFIGHLFGFGLVLNGLYVSIFMY